MAITYFQITQLPNADFVEGTFNGAPLVLNQQFTPAEQNLLSFKRTALYENRAVFSRFKWKAIDSVNNRQSNEAFVELNWPATADVLNSSNITLTILNSEIVNIFTVLNAVLSNSVTQIQINSFSGSGILQLNNSNVFFNQIINILELSNLVYTALSTGFGNPYFQINYSIGDENGIDYLLGPYTISFVIDQPIIALIPATRSVGEISEDGSTTCALTVATPCFIYAPNYNDDGVLEFGDIVYETNNTTTPLLGANQWFKIQIDSSAFGVTYQINNEGILQQLGSICAP